LAATWVATAPRTCPATPMSCSSWSITDRHRPRSSRPGASPPSEHDHGDGEGARRRSGWRAAQLRSAILRTLRRMPEPRGVLRRLSPLRPAWRMGQRPARQPRLRPDPLGEVRRVPDQVVGRE
jgi:hypothetical protein